MNRIRFPVAGKKKKSHCTTADNTGGPQAVGSPQSRRRSVRPQKNALQSRGGNWLIRIGGIHEIALTPRGPRSMGNFHSSSPKTQPLQHPPGAT